MSGGASMFLMGAAMAVLCTSCINVHVDPIYAKLDINVKVDRELDSFFETVAAKTQSGSAAPPSTAVPGPATLPVTPPAAALPGAAPSPLPATLPSAAPGGLPATLPTTLPETLPTTLPAGAAQSTTRPATLPVTLPTDTLP